jgi:hypothetical protein
MAHSREQHSAGRRSPPAERRFEAPYQSLFRVRLKTAKSPGR